LRCRRLGDQPGEQHVGIENQAQQRSGQIYFFFPRPLP
jgi:hypothetical protein